MSNFSVIPTVSIGRSKFNRTSTHKTSGKLGQIIPVYLDEVLPGDTRKIDFGALCRLSNLVFPVMDDIYLDFYAFFVPNRLTWSHWKEFMGENNTSAGIYTGSEYRIPSVAIGTSGIAVDTLGDHLGLPVMTGVAGISVDKLYASALPVRAYRLIYNRFFRDQNTEAPLIVNTADATNTYDAYNVQCETACKLSDYFTRALPYAQKGAPVTIPLGTNADVNIWSDFGPNNDMPIQAFATGIGPNPPDPQLPYKMYFSDPGDDSVVHFNVDLSQATAATINQLRFAFQYQKMLEKDAMYGTRYWEILKAHFGIIAPDASLQDPEYLGHHRINVNIEQVVQTTGIDQATPSQNELGQLAGVSVTGGKGHLFTKSFTEHGFIMVLAVMRHKETYGQGLDRMFSRAQRTDYYFPVFANLGAQEIKNKEIYAQADNANNEKVFGYQEAWSEYRYKNSKVTGYLNPSVAGSLGYATLASNFGALPTLSSSFLKVNRDALGRVLSTGTTGPDFILDLAFKDVAVRPMPMYSIPGLIDHH